MTTQSLSKVPSFWRDRLMVLFYAAIALVLFFVAAAYREDRTIASFGLLAAFVFTAATCVRVQKYVRKINAWWAADNLRLSQQASKEIEDRWKQPS